MGAPAFRVIVEVPENDKGIRTGDRCAIEPYISCGECRPCAAGRTNCCERLRLFGIHIDGGMQGVMSVPLSLLHKSDLLSLDQLVLIEPLEWAHTPWREANFPREKA
jgi:threonine dehydrogenase-like Zn-dependent dehydrogenase